MSHSPSTGGGGGGGRFGYYGGDGSGYASSGGGGNASAPEGRERGARRRKLAGYLKAANELRQSYQAQYVASRGQNQQDSDLLDDEHGIPGAFPDVAIVRSGDEEMVLFPSYARRHVRKERDTAREEPPQGSDSLGAHARIDGTDSHVQQDAAYWKERWEQHEDDNAVVDVDVRGWIYSPHRGPLSRKNRLLIGLARRLSGIPAPTVVGQESGNASDGADDTRLHTGHHGRSGGRYGERHEEELIERQAESIMRKGEGEADIAGRGGYSEDPAADSDKGSTHSGDGGAQTPIGSSSTGPKSGQIHRPLTDSSLRASSSDPGSLANRSSWNNQTLQQTNLSPAELSKANARLMARLKPFMTIPLANTPITVFFYNSKTSQSRTVVTNESGHFAIRAALDFVPTHIRVLASESLSATAEVRITEPTGISLISDIDDTIKHSAIGSGAREIFRNTFIRELGDLTIKGVKEWYSKLADMGVKIHYVSNSPWQLYPLLVTYFTLAGLPPGSFHLKQYSGMLQGIFEPVAERKKGTLEKILRDFPERKFILVGDSGEADLEVYTDVVLANPERVIGVFIRDITTPQSQGFFDSSMGALRGGRNGTDGPSENKMAKSNSEGTLSRSVLEEKPVLPSRLTPDENFTEHTGPKMGKLIDFDEDDSASASANTSFKPPAFFRSMIDYGTSHPGRRESASSQTSAKSYPPTRPPKPAALRGNPTEEQMSFDAADSALSETHRKPPPIPPKPRKYSNSGVDPNHSTPLQPPPRQYSNNGVDSNQSDPPQPPPRPQPTPFSSQTTHEPYTISGIGLRQTYLPNIRGKVSSVYNSLPSASDYWHGTSTSSTNQQNLSTAFASSTASTPHDPSKPPQPPARRGLTAYPIAAAAYATNRLYGSSAAVSATGEQEYDANGNPVVVNKKEELWKRRWARAKGILEEKGVVLRAWREGGDVEGEAVSLVERVKRGLEQAGCEGDGGRGTEGAG